MPPKYERSLAVVRRALDHAMKWKRSCATATDGTISTWYNTNFNVYAVTAHLDYLFNGADNKVDRFADRLLLEHFLWIRGRVIFNSADPLRVLILQSPILAWTAGVLLLTCCTLLVAFRHQQRRLTAMQVRLDSHSSDIRRLEVAHEALLVRFMNSPKSHKAGKSSNPSSNTLEENTTAPPQPDEKRSMGSALYVVAPKTTPE